MREKKHMLRDNAFRYAHQMPLLMEDGVAMRFGLVQQVNGPPVPVMEISVTPANEIEREGAQSGRPALALLAMSIVRLDFG